MSMYLMDKVVLSGATAVFSDSHTSEEVTVNAGEVYIYLQTPEGTVIAIDADNFVRSINSIREIKAREIRYRR